MALTLGTRLGSYEILSALGAGGMGEVYRARDTKLNRDVALKVLPDLFARDPDRLARFKREAQVLAALNHPHIAQIHGLEDSGTIHALVMELVEGPTVAERLAEGPLPLSEAISVAKQIAEALEAAHEQGIIHRDLKPANVKLRPDGTVKVLDFGLAKVLGPVGAVDGHVTASPTVTSPAKTAMGLILGTAAYMSPEQARGQTVDKRTDIWAFGCVLYEMLSGRAAFAGETLSDIFARVLEREPDWARLPERTPAAVRHLLRRCLEKDPQRRVRDIADARLDLEEVVATGGEALAGPTLRRGLPWMLAAIAIGAASALGVLVLRIGTRGHDTAASVARTTVRLPANHELDIRGRAAPLALSPDGLQLAYVARSAGRIQLYVRAIDAFDAHPIAGTDGAHYPFFSPDGQSVGFFTDGKLKRASIRGGSPTTVCDVPVVGRGGTWSRDGTIVFDPGDSGLMRVPASGGIAERVTTRDPKIDASDLSWPHFLPNGRALLATAGGDTLMALSLDRGTWQTLGRGNQVQYVPSGHLVFHAPSVREGELHAVRFDVERLAIRGEPFSVLAGVFRSENSGGAYFAVAASGTLVFAPGGQARTLVRVDRNGRRMPLLEDRRGFRFPRVSPDGRRVAVTIDPRPSQIWIYDLARRVGVPVARNGHNILSAWTPDSRAIAYFSSDDMYLRAADASSEAQPLLARDRAQYPDAWSRNGRLLVFTDQHATNGNDIWVLPLDGKPYAVVATRANEHYPRLSPDDRWLAYMSDESGSVEVYVRPFPDVDAGKWLVSAGGGGFPVWSPSGRELLYLNGTTMMSVSVASDGATFNAGAPEVLFKGPFETGSPNFDISPDGTYFVMVEADADATPTRIEVVQNWFEELKRLVPRQ